MKTTKIVLLLITAPFLCFGQWTQVLNDIDGEGVGDRSGVSVSLSGDGSIVAVGAPHNDGNGSNSGHVRIYQNNGSSWIQLGADIDGEAMNDYSGSSISLSEDGTTVAIGANGNDANAPSSGHVRIYKYINSSWVQLGSDIDGLGTNYYFGMSVSLSGDGTIVAIGALATGSGSGGKALVYKYIDSSWVQLGLDINGGSSTTWFGEYVRLSKNGDTMLIGGHYNNPYSSDGYDGFVRAYHYNGTSWNQLGDTINVKTSEEWRPWGMSLSGDGSTIALGSPAGSNIEESDWYSGYVRLFQYNGTSWEQKGSTIFGEDNHDFFGRSTSLSYDGNIVAVTSFTTGGPPWSNAYEVEMYTYNCASWEVLGQSIEGSEDPSDRFGYNSISLSSDGTKLAVGATYNGVNSGRVQVYSHCLETLSVIEDNGVLTANQPGVTYQWYQYPDILLSGETNQSFIPSASGDYYVEISTGDCSALSTCITVENLSTEDWVFNQDIKLYPNPAENNIHISGLKNNIEYIIIDIFGKEILSGIISNNNRIVINKLSSGMYFFKMKNKIIRFVKH